MNIIFPSNRLLYAIFICYIAFFYPLIALYNQYTNQGTNILSLFYRSTTFIISFVIIFKEGILKKNRPILAGMGLLIIFWIYYLIKLLYDLLILGLIQNPLLSASYYLLLLTNYVLNISNNIKRGTNREAND